MITDLLDQIDRLDKEATQAPWKSHFGGNPHDEWLSVEPEKGSRTICTVTDDHQQNAEFISLARDALPKLAKALQAVMDCVIDMEKDIGDESPYDAGISHMAGTVRHIVTDALGADDD